jgi:CBS domain containing-hemolysin-like protein
MPENQVRNSGEPETSFDKRNLPVPVQGPTETAADGESLLGRLTRALFGWKAGSIRADLEVVLEAGASGETGFSPEERTLLKNILGLRGRRVGDVMVPRSDIIAVQQDITLGELVRVFESAGHSRLVVYNDTLDDPIGMVHIRDLVAFMSARAQSNAQRRPSPRAGLDLKAIDLAAPLSLTKIMRSILFVPPSMPAIDLLAKMQATRIHLALVIDEYGGTDGLVSIEDIVEQIVGEIEDEHDTDTAPTVTAQRDGSFIADARASLEEVTKLVGAEFDVGEAAEDVDTLGGFLVTQIGRVPVRGELVPGPGQFEIEVLDADPRRVKKVRIHRGRRRPALNREGRRRDAEGEPARVLPPPLLPPSTEPQSNPAGQEPTFESASPAPPRQS